MKNKENKQIVRNKIILEAKNIVKKYRNDEMVVEVLKGVSINIKQGEIVAIVGPSGCGKTTLLNCLSGIDNLDGGSIRFNDKDFDTASDNEKTKTRAKDMGFIFQSFNLIPVLTALENIELPMLITKSKESRDKAKELLKKLGLEGKENHKPNQLSGGEQQRVAIARALVNDPLIVWADEPTGNLDTKNSEETIKMIQSLNKEQGVTFVIVTHDLNIAAKANKVIRMDSGKIV